MYLLRIQELNNWDSRNRSTSLNKFLSLFWESVRTWPPKCWCRDDSQPSPGQPPNFVCWIVLFQGSSWIINQLLDEIIALLHVCHPEQSIQWSSIKSFVENPGLEMTWLLIVLQMLPWNRTIYHTKFDCKPPPCQEMTENRQATCDISTVICWPHTIEGLFIPSMFGKLCLLFQIRQRLLAAAPKYYQFCVVQNAWNFSLVNSFDVLKEFIALNSGHVCIHRKSRSDVAFP